MDLGRSTRIENVGQNRTGSLDRKAPDLKVTVSTLFCRSSHSVQLTSLFRTRLSRNKRKGKAEGRDADGGEAKGRPRKEERERKRDRERFIKTSYATVPNVESLGHKAR